MPLNISNPPTLVPTTVKPISEGPDAPAPLLIARKSLAVLLTRSLPSLDRDDAAGRIPAAMKIGGSKRWRLQEIKAWVEAGCPGRKAWDATKS